MRCARIAPSTMPITVAPTMPMTETWTVRQRPSASTPRLSQIADQSNAASKVTSRWEQPPLPRLLPLQRCLGSRAVGRKVLADRIRERRLSLARDVVVERRPEPLGDVGVQDL